VNWTKYIGDKIDSVYTRRVKRIVRTSKRKEIIKRLFNL
jgi:hypothetical protein